MSSKSFSGVETNLVIHRLENVFLSDLWIWKRFPHFRSLSDINVPKFINEDIDLFRAIMKDLFPKVEENFKEKKALKAAIRWVKAGFVKEKFDCDDKKMRKERRK